MLTLVTVPRSFNGDVATRQLNAIRSWKVLNPSPTILLSGNDEGVESVSAGLKVRGLLSKLGAFLIKRLMPYKDPTGGFKGYRRDPLRLMQLVKSPMFAFQF